MIKNKVAIITGSSKGIGKQIALHLAKLNITVVINYNSNKQEAQNLVDKIVSLGGNAIAFKADISKIIEIEKLFENVLNEFGKIDILINNAGIMENNLLKDVTEEEFDRQFLTNVKGTFFSCQQAMKYLSNNGRIINISTSVNGVMFPAYSVYAASKGAVEQITRQLAKEFGIKGITINAIAPGPVATNLFLEGKSKEQIDNLSKMNSFGRLGNVEDIANSVELLIDEKSQWITGQTIRVNGGFI
ncbi:SDR family oxidoreductase [Halarcobacter sp.]|uniref:SDR family oxidoreductase n=1 Tax=Halarcobacter sp. TaxID=2321133 RepID=UPI0029F56A2C|nr:SDR family oxidoreductase [Halarcobacter sp.]